MASIESNKQWAHHQIEASCQIYPRYIDLAHPPQPVLKIVSQQTAPLALIQPRSKALPSIAGKAIRRKKAGGLSTPAAAGRMGA